jgi:predicted Zn-dependent protease
MIKKYTYTFLILIFLIASPLSFSQKAKQHKPNSSSKEKIEYYYDESEPEKAEIPRKYYSEFSRNKNRTEIFEDSDKNSDFSKKKFINYTSYSRNYFRIDDSDNSLWNGKYWNYGDYPLKVYVKKSSSRNFKDKYTTYIDYAFKIWSFADERIKFVYSKSASDADIIFKFEDNLMEKYDENYLGLTDYELEKNNRIIRSFIEISLLKFDDRKISDGEIKSTIIHELGHALGLGHSTNHVDLMYPYISEDSSDKLSYIELSTGDIEAVKSVVDLGNNDYSTR